MLEVNGVYLESMDNTRAMDALKQAIHQPYLKSTSTGQLYSASSNPPPPTDTGPFTSLCVIVARRLVLVDDLADDAFGGDALQLAQGGVGQLFDGQFIHSELYALCFSFVGGSDKYFS